MPPSAVFKSLAGYQRWWLSGDLSSPVVGLDAAPASLVLDAAPGLLEAPRRRADGCDRGALGGP